MPIPALLAAALPYLGTAAAGFAGNKLASLGSSSQNQNVPGSFLFGQSPQTLRFEKFNPEQQKAFSQILQQSLAGLGQNKFDFAPIESQARQGFSQQAIPGIAERFSQLNAQRSSAFPQILGQAASGLETNLAALKSQHNLGQQQLLQSMLGLGLSPQFESAYSPRQPGFLETGAQGVLAALPYLAMSKFGGA